MAPAIITGLAHQARSFVSNTFSNLPETSDITARSLPLSSFDTSVGGSPLGPLAARSLHVARDEANRVDPHKGAINPAEINNTIIFVLFGIIGAGIIVTTIWFFFWAKNGGFYFKETDWDDYKTTVLRRRGPNGTLLSGATPSTNLGGGSVYKDMDDATTTVSDSTAMSGITAGVSDIASRENRKKKLARKSREKRENTRRHVGEDGVLIDEDAEREAKSHLRSYRHERPARVGGLNKEPEGSSWDGSTNPTDSTVASDLLSNRERTPTNTPTKSGGIRKVYSTADREQDRIRAEAKKLQEKGRAAGSSRRDFSFQRAESTIAESEIGRREPERSVPGSWNDSEVGSHEGGDLGTKSYRHVIPGLSPATSDFAEDKRKKRQAGYRRNRE